MKTNNTTPFDPGAFLGRITAPLIAVALLTACAQKAPEDNQQANVTADTPDLTAMVDTIHLQSDEFSANIISNGRVKASRYADLFFRTAEPVSEVMVKNGQRVRKGQPLARLDLFRLNSQKIKNEAVLEQARLEMQDVLIGQGFDPRAADAVPEEVMRLARVRSGLLQAETEVKANLQEIAESTLSAPFDGVVANVKAKPYSMASSSEPFCLVIDTSSMEVEFSVLESEGLSLKPGDHISAAPFSGGGEYEGRITEINPLIDENGHITVKASLSGSNDLIDGMNMRVSINRDMGPRLMVPKSAVVLRSGRQVVFTFKDGKAMWNYVTTGLENFASYEITEGLKPGDAVIISGCENLSHEAPVMIKR